MAQGMADPHVTVTLGRSGKVVKRGGSRRYTGSDEFLTVNKSCKWIILNGNMVLKPLELGEGSWIARNDLRLKLMWKRCVEERRKRVLNKNMANANLLQCHPQAKGTHLLRQNPPTEILNDFHPGDSFFFNDFHPEDSFSSQTIDRSRARSPGRNWTTLGFSAPGSFNVLQQVPAIRVAEVARAGRFSNAVLGASRQAAHMRYPVAPSGGFMQKSALMGVEHLTVAGVLESLGLRKYEITFQAEEVDMPALKQMSDKDLKELGIPMGPRKKILLALKQHPKQSPP